MDIGMFTNYFKTSVRNLIRHKGYTAINVIGVAVGLSAFLLIKQYIRFERSYDSFYDDSEVIYRLTTDQIVEGQLGTKDAMSFNPSGKIITDEIPEVNDYTLTYNLGRATIRKVEALVEEQSVKVVDENFINFFDHTVISGSAESMLKEPNSIVLTESKARFYFGNEEAIGKTLHVFSGFDRDFKVTGIIEDVPLNTHFKFDLLISIATIQDRLEDEGWNEFNYYTYLKVDEGSDISILEKRLIPIKNKYLTEESTLFFNLQPIEEIHLNSDMTFEPEATGSKKSINFLEIISIFILIIAWVNYVNLSTAKAVERAKEAGLRKVIGANKGHLRSQFLIEALLINIIGAGLAVGIASIVTPSFNTLVGYPILGEVWRNTSFISMLGIFTVIGTFISGFYPAIFLSNFKITSVIKGKFQNSSKGIGLRKGLVILQFTTSMVLISCTLVVMKQVQFMQSKDLGMNLDHVLSFPNPQNIAQNEAEQDEYRAMMNVFKNRLQSASSILGVTSASVSPGGDSDEIWSTSGGVRVVGLTERLEATTYIQAVEDNYFDLLSISLKEGRDFISESISDDTTAVIVNQAFIDRFNISEESILNEKIQFGNDPQNSKYTIIGVIDNVNRTTLKKSTEPTCYFYDMIQDFTLVKLSSQNLDKGIKHIEETWAQLFPTTTLDYSFINDRFDQLYKEDRRFGTVFSIFSILALFVAILGLFGLISFIATQRTKEVGVRKVLGASPAHIISIFFREFFVLIGIATVIGIPIIFFGMTNWLSNYSYRVDFPWLVILIALASVTLCSFITVSTRVMKVASLNPAKTLKYE